MEGRANLTASAQLKNESEMRAHLDRTAEERSEDDGMPEHTRKAADPQAWEAGRVERNCQHGITRNAPMLSDRGATSGPERYPQAPRGGIETTDLERRVLAHERILQALIAHMSESEPKFLAHLDAIFREPMRLNQCEHDYTDTDAYAERFVRGIMNLSKSPVAQKAPRNEATHPIPTNLADSDAHLREDKSQLIQIKYRAGIWEVAKNGHFYSDYHTKELAQKAVQEAVDGIASTGGSAVVSYVGSRQGQNRQ